MIAQTCGTDSVGDKHVNIQVLTFSLLAQMHTLASSLPTHLSMTQLEPSMCHPTASGKLLPSNLCSSASFVFEACVLL